MFCLGVFRGIVDKFPLDALMNKGLTLRGAQQHGQRYIPMLLDRIATGELPTRHLATHPMRLDDGPASYRMFKEKDGCGRAGVPAVTRGFTGGPCGDTRLPDSARGPRFRPVGLKRCR
ncbi:hypothetical protein [Actinokineospora sp. NBRC 105648]|uniref:hypothetical protein n=1 Tax=Actinokineospora sp. NBRC 105648 TaxID=3032206 RepID=UPI0025555D82|nr:hypothetical protein [Actinokineospora sp. NBRC 105648]